MPFPPRPIASTLHGVTDYSAFTDCPLGVMKVIPYQAHLALDALGAQALAAAPFVTGQFKSGRDQWVPHRSRSAYSSSARSP